MTFPADGPWELPAREWHFDFMPAVAGPRLVAPYLDGGEAFRVPRVRAALAAHPWLRGLWEPGHGGDRIQRYMIVERAL